MRRILQTLTIVSIAAVSLTGCKRENNLEKAYNLLNEHKPKIEVAKALVSDTVMMDSLNNEQMAQLEECLEYIKGVQDSLDVSERNRYDYIIQDKIKKGLDTKSTTVGGEVIDNPDSEIVPSTENE